MEPRPIVPIHNRIEPLAFKRPGEKRKLHDVHLRITKTKMNDDPAAIQTSIIPLNRKLFEYAVRTGAPTIGIVIPLLKDGKVVVNCGQYTERMELVDPSDKLQGPQVMELYEEFVESVKKMGIHMYKAETQKIFAQYN